MHRTQIYLDDEIYSYLEKEKKRTHLSYSEIIRLKLKANAKGKLTQILSRMEKVSGAWDDNGISPESYVNNIRSDRSL